MSSFPTERFKMECETLDSSHPHLSFTMSFLYCLFFCCLYPDDNPGREEPTEEKAKGGNESQGEDEDLGLDKNERDEDKSGGDHKDEGEDKGGYIPEPQRSVSVFRSSAMMANRALKWRNNAILSLPFVMNGLFYSLLSA